MFSYPRKIHHQLSAFRVSLPVYLVHYMGWASCKYVTIENRGRGYLVIKRFLESDECQQYPRGAYNPVTQTIRSVVIFTGTRIKWKLPVQRIRSGYVLGIPKGLVRQLGWESCKYVNIKNVGQSCLIIRRLPGEEKRNDKGAKYPVVGD